jgi:magnesium-transporting ATPase (P-type)
VFASVTLQFAAHLAALVYTVEAAKRLAPEVDAAYNAATAAAAAAAAAAAGNATVTADAASAVNATLAEAVANATNATNATNASGAEAFVHPLDAPFHPSLVNTVSFLVNMFIQTATILVNYIGEPFCVSLWNNKPLLYSVIFAYAFLVALITEAFEGLNQSMEMVPMPAELAQVIAAAMAADLAACWLVERCFARAFPARATRVALALSGGADGGAAR